MLEVMILALPFFYLLLISCVTPGPNNVLLTASGMNFGYIKTIPHILGSIVGFSLLMLLCAYGIGEIYNAYPPLAYILKAIGALYLSYLAYRILTAKRVSAHEKAEKTNRPLTFWEGAGFQFINPKCVVFGIAAINLLPVEWAFMVQAIIIIAAVIICCLISTHLWVLFGKILAAFLQDDKTRRYINIALACMLFATIPMMLF